ncbi:hypothetical protein FRX31_029307 [Thalictrum thalictroides]|uniref:Peptidase C1A papain C-terminal domain-containing protein n=1 Tax=Thalictrum thalictroides TaxID=46969 RepID=A0A7J6V7V3_THATH|nr:hypothetical protein FRX31_029307 [Thalictrum thalictroides]
MYKPERIWTDCQAKIGEPTEHVVLIIGYGVDEDQPNDPYFVLQNSYGTDWGDNGTAKISMHGNILGIKNWLTSPIFDKNLK